jgi:osmoprotectant transport system permease protein
MKWLSQNLSMVVELTAAHLALAVPAILLSLLIAVPIGRLAAGTPRLRDALLGGVGVLYAIPSLPLFILIPSLTGAGLRSPSTAVIVLTVYGVAVMVRSAADAFIAVPTGALLTADALGYSRARRFWGVELPLALPVMVAGLRVVSVSTIGLVTVAALIGIQSLGTLFTDGFQRGIIAEVITGLVMTAGIAIALDLLLAGAGRALTPWVRTAATTEAVR